MHTMHTGSSLLVASLALVSRANCGSGFEAGHLNPLDVLGANLQSPTLSQRSNATAVPEGLVRIVTTITLSSRHPDYPMSLLPGNATATIHPDYPVSVASININSSPLLEQITSADEAHPFSPKPATSTSSVCVDDTTSSLDATETPTPVMPTINYGSPEPSSDSTDDDPNYTWSETTIAPSTDALTTDDALPAPTLALPIRAKPTSTTTTTVFTIIVDDTISSTVPSVVQATSESEESTSAETETTTSEPEPPSLKGTKCCLTNMCEECVEMDCERTCDHVEDPMPRAALLAGKTKYGYCCE